MKECLPGTVIEARIGGEAMERLDAIFVTNGLVLCQVCELLGTETHNIHNWVKRGFCSPPQNKRYSKRQFCRLAIINALKDTLEIAHIVRVLSYVNGSLSDESDDKVPDDRLYCCFAEAVARLSALPLSRKAAEDVATSVAEESGYRNTPELTKVLTIITTAYLADALRKSSIERIKEI